MRVWVCLIGEVVGVSGRSSLLGETQENKVVCLTPRCCPGDPLASSCTPTYSLVCFRLMEFPDCLEFGWFGSRPESPPGF